MPIPIIQSTEERRQIVMVTLERPGSTAAAFPPAWPTARRSPAPARRASPKPFGQTGLSYNFACTICGKTFKRVKYDATLNPHKNKQGWPCPGRTGFLKGTSA